jgi:flavin-dependent dehydrogenase
MVGTLASERGNTTDLVDEVDVLVVGARVAGSILATLLGQAGRQVLVVDRGMFPSATISTHFFRGEWCVAALDRIGVLKDVLATGAPPLVREYNADALDGSWSIDPPQDPGSIGYCLSVRRETLDAILVERARRESSVTLMEHTSVQSLNVEGERVTGVTIITDVGVRFIRARVVVGADGHASRVAREVGAETQELITATRAMYYRYLQGMEGPEGAPDGPEFSAGDDDLAYVFPSDQGYSCLAISYNLTDYAAARTRAEEAFDERIAAHPFIAERAAAALPSGRLWACGPRDAIVRRPVGPGWALVGDASMLQDPWTGNGMDFASTHASYLAESIDDLLAGRATESAAWAAYHRRRDEHGLPGWRETGELGKDLNAAFRSAP